MKFSTTIVTAFFALCAATDPETKKKNLRGQEQQSLHHEDAHRKLFLSAIGSGGLQPLADNREQLQQRDPTAFDLVDKYHPVFDFDDYSCKPALAVNRNGVTNKGLDKCMVSLEAYGDLSGVPHSCRNTDWRDANTYHRWTRETVNGIEWEVHMYELYFETDFTESSCIDGSVWDTFTSLTGCFGLPCPSDLGHKHDVETAILVFENQKPKYMGVSAHGKYEGHNQFRQWDQIEFDSKGHPKVIYHKEGGNTHSFRFADKTDGFGEAFGEFVMPPLVSWNEMTGTNLSNEDMKKIFNDYSKSTGAASFKFVDGVTSEDVDGESRALQSSRKEVSKVRQVIEDMTGRVLPPFDFGNPPRSIWISEETESNLVRCQGGNFINKIYCDGKYCDNLSIRCGGKSSDGMTAGKSTWQKYFSEERSKDDGWKSCGTDSVVSGIGCAGKYCDNIRLECTEVTNKHINYDECKETSWFSEEHTSVDFPSGKYAVSVKCDGRYCDNKRVKVRSIN